MRHASAALIALLNSATEYLVADLLTIVPLSGSPVRLTTAQRDLVVVSQYPHGNSTPFTFLSWDNGANPLFKRGTAKLTAGTQVDRLPVTIMADPTTQTYGGVPWPAAARAGLFDGARVVVEKVLTADWNDLSAGTLILFWGRIGQCTPKRSSLEFEVVSDFELMLTQDFPRNSWQPGCVHTLFDTGCTLVASSFAVSGAVASAPTIAGFNSNLTNPDGYFSLGKIVFTSGALNGLAFSVKAYAHTSGAIQNAGAHACRARHR